VTSFFIGNTIYDNVGYDTLAKCEDKFSTTLLIESILNNSLSGRIEMCEDAIYRPTGNFIDCCLKWFLIENEIEVHRASQMREQNVLLSFPTNSKRMRATTIVKVVGRASSNLS